MTERQLRAFTQVAAEMNFSRASDKLHITQPALTRAVQEFETQLGVRLFHRTTRRLALTSEGQRFLPVAQRLLDDMRHAVADLQDQTAGLSGTVSVATGTAFACVVLARLLRDFRHQHPGVRVRLRDDNSEGITDRVSRAEVDFGIGSILGEPAVLTARKLLDAPLGLLAHPRHFRLPARPAPRRLFDLPLVKEADDTSIMRLLRLRGSDVVAAMEYGIEVSSLATQLALAAAGAGVAVLSALGASTEAARGLTFVPLVPAVKREVFLFNRADRPLRPAARALVDAIVAALPRTAFHPRVHVCRPLSSDTR